MNIEIKVSNGNQNEILIKELSPSEFDAIRILLLNINSMKDINIDVDNLKLDNVIKSWNKS